MKVALLSGGTGGAKLATGLAAVMPASDLSIVVNTGDDDEFWGLLVSPDIDAILYRLAGVFNEASGFGVRNDTFQALDMLRTLGEDAWFQLGDRDIGVHLLRGDADAPWAPSDRGGCAHRARIRHRSVGAADE